MTPLLPNPWALDDVVFKSRPKLKKEATAANEALAKIRSGLQKHRDFCEKSKSIDLESMDLLNAVAANSPLELQTRLYQEIVAFRRNVWATLLENLLAALREEFDAAHEKWREAQETAKAQLVELGYEDLPVSEPHPCKIQPIFIQSHPEVFAAMQYKDTMHGRLHSFDTFVQQNEAGIDGCLGELNEIRRKFVAAAEIPDRVSTADRC